MVWLKRAPSSATLLSVIAEITKATNTPRMHSVCDRRRPIQLPPKVVPKTPASRAPARGASGTMSRVEALRVWLMVCWRAKSALERVEFVDVDVGLVAEQQDQDRQPDGRLRSRHRQDEEDEHLAVHVAQVVGEGDEVHVDREQHQLDGHQQHDEVAAVQE